MKVWQNLESLDENVIMEERSDAAHVKSLEISPARVKQVLVALDLHTENLTQEERQNLVSDFADVFALLGRTDMVVHTIHTGDHPPIKHQPYHCPMIYWEKLSQMIDKMTEQVVVQPSSSLCASPVVLVPKKDGDLRFGVEYRRLNAVTHKDMYPLPWIEDILSALGEAKLFSTVDFASGYWQVELDYDYEARGKVVQPSRFV